MEMEGVCFFDSRRYE